MANYYHGPEVIESSEGGNTVRDVKAATLYLTGTAPVQLVHADAASRANYIETDVLIRSKADAVAAFGPFNAAAGYTIPAALHAIFNKDRGRGVGTVIVRNVFDPDKHKVNGVASPVAVTTAEIVGGLNAAGKPAGLEGALYTYAKLGYFPRRLIAPGYSTALGVRQKMLAIANRVHGHAITDLPLGLTKQTILEQRGVNQPYQFGDDRLVYCAPHVKALDAATGDQSLQPLSQHFGGLWNEVVNREEADSDGGPAASPSNRAMPDVSGTEIPLSFYPGDYGSDVNDLNEAGIVTVNMGAYGDGVKSWGAHASSFGASGGNAAMQWLHVRALYDIIHEGIQWALMPYIDRRGTISRIEHIEDEVQKYILQKVRDGWLYDGRFRFNRVKNTPEEIMGQGRFWYQLDSTPMAIMHRVSVESFIDINLVRTALGLGGTVNG